MTDPEEKDAADDALDEIATLCGCPQWDYPGQVVRDVRALRNTLKSAQHYVQLATMRSRPGPDTRDAAKKLDAEIEALIGPKKESS